ncbi:putative quinol monooxygenase [Roseibium algae]|uniref:Quinol monooxygenase n=1 Tax=Roseibium algae TaxID=3123038 RepID=A0ABU8TIC5_9HYPH
MTDYFISAGIEAANGVELPEVEQALKALVQATATEPGCISFEIRQDLENPRRFILWERWKNPQALADHFEAVHTKAVLERKITNVLYIEKLGPIGLKKEGAGASE